MLNYYSSLTVICTTSRQRFTVAAFKTFFDVITYALSYALVPAILSLANLRIHLFALYCLPLMLTMFIPFFVIKEGAKYGYPERKENNGEKTVLIESFKGTFKNKLYRRFMLVNCVSFFGLQLFLSSMNGLFSEGLGLSGVQMTIINTFAFAPVPMMLYLFNKIRFKKGFRLPLQIAALLFAVGLLSFGFMNKYFTGDNVVIRYIIVSIGYFVASFSIGSFFMLTYIATLQIAGIENSLINKNKSAMYFAVSGLFSAIVGALASTLVYGFIKNL